MNASYGIDHPLLATHDINRLREHFMLLGFNMTSIGKHPWGTSTSLAMFDGCLLEIMGIDDAALIDEVPAGNFRFGRHVYEHLQVREGVSLTALHSTDSQEDASHAMCCGFNVAGHLEFGREVTLPGGVVGRTKTTLALLPDEQFPRLSFFLCQQHRPELIYVPEWLEHPNKVTGISGVNIVAEEEHHEILAAKFGGLYDSFDAFQGGFVYHTANGALRVFTANSFQNAVGPIAVSAKKDTSPFIAGMDFFMSEPDRFEYFLKQSQLPFKNVEFGYVMDNPKLSANTTLRFLSSTH